MRRGRGTTVKLDTGLSRSVVQHGKPLELRRRKLPPLPTEPIAASTSASTSASASTSLPATESSTPPSATSLRTRMPGVAQRQTLTLEHQRELKDIGFEKRRKVLETLGAFDRTTLEGCAVDASEVILDDYVDVPLGLTLEDPDDEDSDVEVVEAFDVLRAGQTYTVIIDEVRGASYVSRVRRSQQTRASNLMRYAQAWAVQWDTLADEYLTWKHSRSSRFREATPLEAIPDDQKDLVFEVEVHALHWRDSAFKIINTGERYINQVLVRRGLLSPSPLNPTLCITLPTLESYRCLRLRHPRLSIQAFVRSLCDTQREVYAPYLYQQFSDTYDVYLSILRRVDEKVQTALQRTTPNWRLLHSCPPCQYKLDEEEPLEYSHLMALDGGMSLKRFANAGSASRHLAYKSDYFLPRSDVDKFAGEVKTRKKGAKKSTKGKEKEEPSAAIDEAAAEDPALAPDPVPGPPDEPWIYKAADLHSPDLDGAISICVERWKANADDSKKGMFNCFEESGIFISVCRHGFILVTADMVASGELAKYPLSILAKLQEVFPDAKLLGYDIGCATKKTVERSSIGHSLRATFVIPSMHGYAHNRPCQLSHHPNYVPGTGLEDFETCERVFSHLNDVARTTRHASAYHRHQAIHLQMQQWDADKYLALGTFLLNNYRQALKIIEDYSDYFSQLKVLKHIKDGDFTRWLSEERAYLQNLQKEPEGTTLAVEYVTALDELQKAEAAHLAEKGKMTAPTTTSDDPGKRKVRASYKASLGKVSHWSAVVSEFEGELDVGERWTPRSEEYQATKKAITEHSLGRTVNKLEQLGVQRLFELQKGHSEGTGYKARTHLANHLKKRDPAIRAAISAYNTAASKVTPPRPPLSFKAVLDITFVSEFDLLRESRFDIQTKQWANRNNRALTDQYYKLVHAKEEITRLNIEVRRLHTWIRDENDLYRRISKKVARTDRPLSLEVEERGLYQLRVNSVIMKKLKRIESLRGFSGEIGPGTRLGGPPPVTDSEDSEDDDETDAMDTSGLEDPRRLDERGRVDVGRFEQSTEKGTGDSVAKVCGSEEGEANREQVDVGSSEQGTDGGMVPNRNSDAGGSEEGGDQVETGRSRLVADGRIGLHRDGVVGGDDEDGPGGRMPDSEDDSEDDGEDAETRLDMLEDVMARMTM